MAFFPPFFSRDWFIFSYHCDQVWFQSSWMSWDLFCDLTCELSWRMFHVHLTRIYILLILDGLFNISIKFIWCRVLIRSTQTVKNLPSGQEVQVQSLGWEDTLEKGMATHSSILAWRTPWTEQPGRLESTGSQQVGQNWTTKTHTQFLYWLSARMTCIVM